MDVKILTFAILSVAAVLAFPTDTSKPLAEISDNSTVDSFDKLEEYLKSLPDYDSLLGNLSVPEIADPFVGLEKYTPSLPFLDVSLLGNLTEEDINSLGGLENLLNDLAFNNTSSLFNLTLPEFVDPFAGLDEYLPISSPYDSVPLLNQTVLEDVNSLANSL